MFFPCLFLGWAPSSGSYGHGWSTMNQGYTLYWGDTHHNTYQHYIQDPPLDEVLRFSSKHLDFYTGAYYTPAFEMVLVRKDLDSPAPGSRKGGHLSEQSQAPKKWRGIHLEGLKEPNALKREWSEFQEVTASWNHPGSFVAFPGYEWQGNGRWGDLNVTYRREGQPLFTVESLPELYTRLRDREAIAVPHHTAYCVGQRAAVWPACDDAISPYAEIFSIHGCSETDEEFPGLRHNSHMGPGVGGGTYQEALDLGLHLGAICSTDNWTNMPGHWGQGLMGCLAEDLSRDSLWEAFKARRVYGVTGDRIQMEFTCNGQQMGSILDPVAKRNLHVEVRGLDALDRIEILKNGKVIATHCHQGTWAIPEPGKPERFKLRIESGWGPRPGDIPFDGRRWEGKLTVGGGRILRWDPCWVNREQQTPKISGPSASFIMKSDPDYVGHITQGANVFEFEADPSAVIRLRLNGLETHGTVTEFAQQSRLLWYRDECVKMIRKQTGVEPENAKRGDVYYQMACKAKIHRAIPEAGYTAEFNLADDSPLTSETHYRVRAEQRNGQRAWSSPIWIKPEQ